MRYYISLIAALIVGISILTACQKTEPSDNAAKKTSSAPADSVDNAPRITLADAKKAFDEGNVIFVDTRAEVAYRQEHVKGSINIPAEAFQTRFGEVPKDKKIITYCS